MPVDFSKSDEENRAQRERERQKKAKESRTGGLGDVTFSSTLAYDFSKSDEENRGQADLETQRKEEHIRKEWEEHKPATIQSLETRDRIDVDKLVRGAILWQKDEAPYAWLDSCQEFIEDKSQAGGIFGARVGHKGFVVITNQRILFACKMGRLAKDYAVTYGVDLEDVMSVSHGRFGFNDKLVILERQGSHRDYVKPKIQSLSLAV